MPARCSMMRTCLRLPFALALVAAGILPSAAVAQRGEPMTESRSGTLVRIEEKGRSRTLVVDVGGEEEEYPITPRVEFEVSAAGDAEFVRPEKFLQARGTVTNDKLFIKSLTIVLLQPRQKTPPSGLRKAPMVEGESVNSWDIAGEIVGSAADTDYPDYTAVEIKTGGRMQRVYLEPGFSVTVKTSDPTVLPIPEGTSVELLGTPRGQRFILSGVKVQLPEALTAAQVFAEEGEAEKPAKDAADDAPEAEKPEAGSSGE
jgi:hypothetical protein